MTPNIPDVLKPYQDKILATLKPVIHITLSPADDLPLWASKVGGKPYLPKEFEYPCDKQGNPLRSLAQINFSDVPVNDILPKQGILGFFIEQTLNNDYAYGLGADIIHQDAFRVLYFSDVVTDVNELHTDFSSINYGDFDELYIPLHTDINTVFAMSFENQQELMSDCDYHVAKHFFDLDDYYQIYEQKGDDKKLLRFLQNLEKGGHKLLGYPLFTQHDPRIEHQALRDYILLFQLDSDEDCQIYWGDSGVVNFFIHPDDLANLDFSKVAYHWDCF